MAEVAEPPPEKSDGLLASLPELTREAFQAKREPGPEPEAEKPAEEVPAEKKEVDPAAPDPAKAAEDDTPEGLTPKAKADWKGLRESRKKAEEDRKKTHEENEALKKKFAELEAAHNPAEVETLRKQLEDYEQRLTVVALEKHPKFEKFFTERTNKLVETAKAIGGDKLATVLQLPDGDYRNTLLQEAFAELDPVKQSRIGAVLNEFDSLKTQKQQELSKAGEHWKALQAEEQQRSKAQAEQHNRVLSEVLDRWGDPKTGVAPLQTREDDKEWNASVESRKEYAREIFNGNMDVQGMAKAAAWAAIAPGLAEQLKGATKAIAELREENAQLKAAKPTLEGGASGEDDDDANMGFVEKVNKVWNSRT